MKIFLVNEAKSLLKSTSSCNNFGLSKANRMAQVKITFENIGLFLSKRDALRCFTFGMWF